MTMPNGMKNNIQDLEMLERMKRDNGGATYVNSAIATSKPVEVGSERGTVTKQDWANTLAELDADIDKQKGLREMLDAIGNRGRSI